MAALSHSPFLQALGWAMLNSIWQMALLFVLYNLLHYFFKTSAQYRYSCALCCLGAGFMWFVYTFLVFYNQGAGPLTLVHHQFAPTSKSWDIILTSASVTYLLLLFVPAYRLFYNWRFIKHLKQGNYHKPALEIRLFVQKVACQLGIKRTVHVYLSNLVQSPVTIGYLKPIILLPFAVLNSLSPQQVEAVLLHELSHIKRYDFLVNFIITLLQTLFYFNPFVKKFVQQINYEREICCDDLVLQFQYDKFSYASALLLLEKNVLASEQLALAATGKNNLLSRIERIVGVEKRSNLTFNRFMALFISFLVILLANSFLLVNKQAERATATTFAVFQNPVYQFTSAGVKKTSKTAPIVPKEQFPFVKGQKFGDYPAKKVMTSVDFTQETITDEFVPVAYDAVNDLVTNEEKKQISQALESTKKVLTKKTWKEVETSIGDGMTSEEKNMAKYEFLNELRKVDWKSLEAHLKTEYKTLNWSEIEAKINLALADLQLDSLQCNYQNILMQLKKTEYISDSASPKPLLLVPDATVKEVFNVKSDLKTKLDSIKIIRERKIVNF